jgi:thiamine-monophosphate kinase
MRISDAGEGSLIKRIRDRFGSPAGVLGIGDDAAILDIPSNESIVYCSDLVAENTHFVRDLHPPDSVGYKSIAVNVSDVGAMGGIPRYCTLSLAMPGDLDLKWMDGLLDGVARACGDFNVSLVGGDTSAADRIFLDVSMLGSVARGGAIRRSGAKAGDRIYVTGSLGGSAFGLEQLRSGMTKEESVLRHLYPAPRHRVGHAIAGRATAMIDISDGLSTDLGHIVEESKVSARIYMNRLPIFSGASDQHALHGGEEYELLITSPDLPASVDGISIIPIGEIIPSSMDHQIFLIDGTRETVLRPAGFQHFSR